MMPSMVESGYTLTKALHTLNAKISIFIPYVFESKFVLIDNQNKPIIVGVVYRSNSAPRADVDMFISNIIG